MHDYWNERRREERAECEPDFWTLEMILGVLQLRGYPRVAVLKENAESFDDHEKFPINTLVLKDKTPAEWWTWTDLELSEADEALNRRHDGHPDVLLWGVDHPSDDPDL